MKGVESMIQPRTPVRGVRIYASIALTLVFFLLLNDTRYLHADILPDFDISQSFSKKLKVAVVETKGCHDEVSASFFSALGQMKEVNVHAYLAAKRFGIGAVYNQLPGADRRTILEKTAFQPANFQDAFAAPNVIVSITSEYDLLEPGTAMTLKHLRNSTYAVLFAVIHHPDELTDQYFKAVKPWIQEGRIRFILLSDHVSGWLLNHQFARWSEKVDVSRTPISTFPPVFVIPEASSNEKLAPKEGKLRFTMQGDLIVGRSPNRDYVGTFEDFGRLMHDESGSKLPLELTVMGEGGVPQLPDNAKGLVNFERSLPYPEFYGIMHFSTALLPALASKDYLDRKASSTIPASLIAGSPLIADQKMLKAYTYLDNEDVYHREDDETEVETIARLATLSPDVRAAKSARLQEKNVRMTLENQELLRNWILNSLSRS